MLQYKPQILGSNSLYVREYYDENQWINDPSNVDNCFVNDQIKNKITHMVNNPDKYGGTWEQFVNCALERTYNHEADPQNACNAYLEEQKTN